MLALPPAHVPPPVVAGVHFTWPSETTVAAGSAVKVVIRSVHRRAQLSLVSVDRNGKAVRALARRTLKSGTFTARVGAPATYELRATVAGRKYWSWITVPAPAPAPVAVPTPAPTPLPLGNDIACSAPRAGNPQLVIDAAAVHPGDTLPVRLINTTSACFFTGICPSLERRQPDLTWTGVGYAVCPAIAVSLPVGGTLNESTLIPPDAALGRYRVRQDGATAEFDVTST